MNATTALTGMLPAIVLLSAALTAVASVLLLRLYRRAVIRSMDARAGAIPAQPPPSKPAVQQGTPLPSLQVVSAADVALRTESARATYDRAARSLRRAALAYGAGGLAYAFVMTVPWMVFTEGGFILSRFLWLFVCHSWPIVLALGVLGAVNRRDWLLIGGGYLAIVIGIAAYALARNTPQLTVGQLVISWLLTNGAETVLLLAFLNRRVRAVGPLVLAFMVAGVTGALVSVELAGQSEAVLRALVSVGGRVGLGGVGIFVLMHVVGFAVFALLGWPLLRVLGRRYETKRISDQSLTLDAMWLLFAVVQSIGFAFEGGAWVLAGLAGFVAYKVVTRLGFALLPSERSHDARASVLLLLRVFALGKRSERLFDVLSKRWLRAGSLCLIAGPDLATTTVEPHEFLAFVGGRLSRQFVQGDADLERRMAALDIQPDPDGRFRVSEFFCHADTWQATMKRLAGVAEGVLMDLRGFTRTNQGCIYELEQLLAAVPLDRLLLVVDGSTDRSFLEQTLADLWTRIPVRSPNRTLAQPKIRLLEARAQVPQMARELLGNLLGGEHLPAAA
ncbi:MAG TPA: hypothetical protein VLW55_01825 [Burkholderiaceae bacterium]|nr:hypothetical protein [Burkholderiaceae bacterium]